MADITSKAILVNLVIGMPGNQRNDTDLTDEITREKSMSAKAGNWVKKLYPPEAFAPLIKESGAARTFHYGHSLPWGEDGSRILPSTHFFDYMEGMNRIKRSFEGLAQSHFAAHYDKWVQWGRDNHGDAFDIADYPGAAYTANKFRFRVLTSPVPHRDDFRVKLAADELAEIQADLDSRINQATSAARKDLWERLCKPLGHMLNKLKNADAKFKDSLVGNVREIAGLVPALNLTDDADLINFANEIYNGIGRANADALRENATFRNETAQKAEEILNRMKGYFA